MDKGKVLTLAGFALASAVVVALGHATSSQGNSAALNEEPIAGVVVAFNEFCDNKIPEFTGEAENNVNEDTTAVETVSQSEMAQTVEDTNAVQPAAAGAIDSNAADTNAAGKTALQADKKQTPAATKAPEFKLNLVYDRLGVVQVKNYLNVRKKPSEDSEIVGKMTNNSGCNVYSIKNGWAKIVSGKVRGYVKAEYLITDKKAEAKAKEVATRRVTVTTETLNVRYLPSIDANVYDQISADEEYRVAKENLNQKWLDQYIAKNVKKSQLKGLDMNSIYADLGNWSLISIDNEKAFISKDFVEFTNNLNRAVTIKQEQSGSDGSSDSSSGASSIVAYAMQFLGNRYVYGGTSLTNGTDCSGFTMGVYRHFGYSLPRTSGAQAAATRTVSPGNERVGDLFFYGSGSVSHVALYIGNGQIIHASNHRDGIKISSAYYRKPIKIGRVM
ncbi:MAG: C40 family peptidase [Lachnospiraceae bacterium]|nr:C40 family peptidase [Lachnospiraceae bacterium]